ncbi:MAG: HlyD family secretion protein [Burkholderiales bacterium]
MAGLARTKLGVLIAVAVVVSLAVVGFRTPTIKEWFAPSKAAPTIVVSGNVEAHASILSFKAIQSRIVELPFDEGQWMHAGTLIARVDDSDYRQQVAIGESALEVQRRQLAAAAQNAIAADKTILSDHADVSQKTLDLQRSESLWKKNFVSSAVRDQAATVLKQSSAAMERDQALRGAAEKNVELAKANVRNADETLKLAKITLAYTTLRAPFDGVILVRHAELGEVVVPGTPIVTLADLDHVWLRAYINEKDIRKIRHGQEVTVNTDTYPGKKYHGRVSFISSSAEFTPKTVETHAQRVTLVYRIRIDIANPTHELVPGMPADAVLDALPPGAP